MKNTVELRLNSDPDSNTMNSYEEYSKMAAKDIEGLSPQYKQHLEEQAKKKDGNPRGNTDSYTAYFTLESETEKAVLLQADPEKAQRDTAEWVPRSQILNLTDTGDVDSLSNVPIYEIAMSTWIARKKGWV